MGEKYSVEVEETELEVLFKFKKPDWAKIIAFPF